MMRSLTLLAALAALTAAIAVGQGADAQVQRGTGNLAPQPTIDPGAGIPTPPTPTPTRPAGPAGFQAKPTQCLPGWTQVQLTHDPLGHLQYMTCQSPIIECPAPGDGYTVGLEVTKHTVNADDGRFRLQYRCTYYKIQG
ncbi:MAG: hypothetical protein ACFCUW_18235 [Kiloniellaceae bacterium]